MKDTAAFLFEQIVAGNIERNTGVELLARLKQGRSAEEEDIAVIGMAVKLPKASDVEQLWRNLKQDVDAIGPYPDSRRVDTDRYLEYMQQLKPNTSYLDGAYLDEIDKFDYKFFNLTPKEAALMSPAQRLFLEIAWETFEEAGYGGGKLSGSRTGVYIGYGSDSLFEYVRYIQDVDPSALSLAVPGNLSPIVASRISHLLDLRGPALSIDTSCSSSLVALHEACQAIRNGECEQALVGGIRINYMRLANQLNMGIQASDGKTRAFDDSSDGTGSGEGVIAVFIKPLGKAVRDGDQIHAVIKGSAINQDGSSIGLTAPNSRAQEEVILQAWQAARVDPQTITYIEAHGTGTKLGDPIEVESIRQAFRRHTANRQFCGIGSVKSNYGHLDNAAGLLGLVKTILSLKHREIPATLHFQKANRQIAFEDSPVYPIDRLTPWRTNGHPLRAGVSSFGLSGTNCHIVLEEAPAPVPADADQQGGYVLPLSAKTEAALRTIVERYSRRLQHNSSLSLADVCYTASTGRSHYAYRLAVCAEDVPTLQTKLERLLQQWPSGHRHVEGVYYGANVLAKSQPEGGRDLADMIERLHSLTMPQDEAERAVLLAKLGDRYTKDARALPWEEVYKGERRRKVALPSYPFKRTRCWIPIPSRKNIAKEQITAVNDVFDDGDSVHKRKLLDFVRQAVQAISGIPAEEIQDEHNFFELGLDSILLFQVSEQIKDRFGAEISLSRFYDDLATPLSLAEHLTAVVSAEPAAAFSGMPSNAETPARSVVAVTPEMSVDIPSDSGSELEKLVARQLDIMSRQLELLRENRSHASLPPSSYDGADEYAKAHSKLPAARRALLEDVMVADQLPEPDVFLPYRKLKLSESADWSSNQKRHTEALISRLAERFKETKELTQKYRGVLANNRNVAGFRPAWKEMIFQVIAKKAQGARIWDVDGHEYIDISMGFGAYLLGHSPSFIVDAVRAELDNGMPIGPMNPLAGEVAEQIAQFTGSERVAFFNSGTEAVMVALRLARAVTGKPKIALFEGAFHGTFDGVLARRRMVGRNGESAPMAPGITDHLVGDVLVLKYNDPEALDVIRSHAAELAAVLVEPVQSRKPDLQPRQFLHELRAITEKQGTALILDEVITGFRTGQGGAQEWFGVQADIATYGKVVGAGLPVGVVAGKAKYLNAIDGGWWQYGDASYPTGDGIRTLVGGTFCHHPLAMASILAMLKHLRQEGPRLQETLNERTRRLTDTLNRYFMEQRIPIHMVRFGSLFRFVLQGDSELLFYHLLEKGIYVWEGRNCFLSTAHTEEDVDQIIRAVIESVENMRAGGFFAQGLAKSATADSSSLPDDRRLTTIVPMTESQQNLWLLARDHNQQSIAHSDHVMLELRGKLNLAAMQSAMQRIVERHEILRAVRVDEQGLHPDPALKAELPLIDFADATEAEQDVRMEEWLQHEAERPFVIGLEPLFRMYMIKLSDARHRLVIVIHHLIADGWSTGVMLQELEALYTAECRGEECQLPPAIPYRQYVEWLSNKQSGQEGREAILYWTEQFASSIPSLALPVDYPLPPAKTFAGGRKSLRVEEAFTRRLKSFSREHNCSLFVTLLSAFQVMLHRLTGQAEFAVGIPAADQSDIGANHLVGPCARTLTLGVSISPERTFADHLKEVKKSFSEGMKHRYFAMAELVKSLAKRKYQPAADFQVIFNLDRSVEPPQLHDLETVFIGYPIRYVKQDLSLNVIETGGELLLDFDYNEGLFSSETASRWTRQFHALLETVLLDPQVVHEQISLAVPGEELFLPDMQDGLYMPAADAVSDRMEQYARALAAAFELESGKEVVIDSQLPAADQRALSLAGNLVGAEARVTDHYRFDLGNEATALFLSAAAWRDITRETKGRDVEEISTIRAACAIIGNEPILVEQVRRYRRKSVSHSPLRLGFRPASLSAILAVGQATGHEEKLKPLSALPIGQPLAYTTVMPLEASGRPAPAGVYAELYATAPWLTVAGDAMECSREGMVATGTLGRVGSEGVLEQRGSIEQQINVRGYCIDPAYVNAVLSMLPQVSDAMIAMDAPVGGDPVMTACLVLEPGVAESATRLRRSLKELLPDFMIPGRILLVDRLLLTPEGAIDLHALAELGREEERSASASAIRMSETERRMQEIWRELLGIEEINLLDNFIELGAQSFQAMLLWYKIQEEWNVELALSDIFSSRSLSELSQRIDRAMRGGVPIIPKARRKEHYPMSSAQKRQYALQQIDPSSTAYNLSAAFVMEGQLDRKKLERALRQLIHRHEALRTSFALINGEAVQIVHDNVSLSMHAEESDDPADERFVRPFDLGQAPLLRVRLRGEGPEKHWIEFDMHHIISDGVSMNILFRDLAAIYQNQEKALPYLEIQYNDYAEWQLAQLGSEEMRRHECYWIEQFAEEPPKLNLPMDYARPAIKSFEGGSHSFIFDEALLQDLNLLSRRSGVTLYMVLLAAYQLFLSKITGQPDIVVGSPSASRSGPGTENVVGMFVNTLPLRVRLEPDLTFPAFLRRVKDCTLGALDHQDYPLDRLLDKLAMERDTSRNPLFDTLFAFDNMNDSFEATAIEGILMEPVRSASSTAQFDLALYAAEESRTLRLTFEYASKLFAKGTVERMARHFEQLVKQVVLRPISTLSELELITEEERALVYELNRTEAEYDRHATLHLLFEKQAASTPERTAAVFGAERLTYRELNERANRLAWTLRDKGVKPDRLVGVLLERSKEMLIGVLAVLKAGGAYVPIDPGLPGERIAYLLRDSGAELLLTYRRELSPETFAGDRLDLADESLYRGDGGDLPAAAGPCDLAYVIYTSGSTGEPKGVMIEHRSVVNRLQWMQKRYPLSEQDVILQKTPFSFDVSVWELFWWGMQGASAVFPEPGAEKNPEAIAQCVAEHRVTVMHFVPSMLQLFLEHIGQAGASGELRTLRRVFASGEALPAKQASRFGRLLKDAWGTELVNLYGPTEATVDVSYHECSCGEEEESVPIGRPIDNLSLYVLDGQRRLQPIGVPGELYIAGIGVARGYWKRPELTEERFVDNPFGSGERMYKTGDVAKWLPNGELEYLGRIDQQVKIRGYRIEPGEIEVQLLKHEGIKEAAVTVRTGETELKDLCAYYVPEDGVEAGEIRAYLAERLPSYMLPAYLVKLEAMPLTPNGKLDRKALPAAEAHAWRETYTAPRNALERQLAAVWQEVLGLERIGIDERYQDMGGDSIKSIRVIYAINKTLQADLQLLEIYQNPTIRELADLLSRRKLGGDGGKLAAAKERLEQWQRELLQTSAGELLNGEIEDFYPLSDIQQGMIYHSVSQPHDQLYHEQFIYEFQDEAFSELTFEQAMQLMIRKHAILRTTFDLNDFPMPIQLVRREVPLDLKAITLDHLGRPEQEAFVTAILEQDRQQPFFQGTRSSYPMWRMRIFRLDERNYLLIWCYHHAILDGWSNASFITELSQIYFGLKQGNVEPKPLRHSYKDLLIEQWSIQDDSASLAYWRAELNDYRRFESPFVSEAIDSDSAAFIRTEFIVSEELNRSVLAQSAKLNQASVKTLIFTAYVCMLNMIDAENDFVVGLVENNRPIVEDGEKILGCFLNSIPIRVRIDGTISWRNLLRSMDKKLADAQQFGRLSLARILQATGENSVDGNRLFDNIFNYVDLHVYEGVSSEIRYHRTLQHIDNYERTNALFQFDCFIEDERLHIVLGHVSAVYPESDAMRMLSAFERILKEIVVRTDGTVGKTSFLEAEQLHELQERARKCAAPLHGEQTVCGLVEVQARRTPQRTALIYGDNRLTYGELNSRADRLAEQLVGRGAGAGHIIGLMADRSAEMIVGLLAVLKAGAAYLPIDPEFPDERIRHMMTDSGMSLLLTQRQYRDRTSFDGDTIDLADEELYREKTVAPRSRSVSPDDLAYCIYTSGSTGLPKGVLIEHRAVANLYAGMTERIGFCSDKTILSITTISFDIFVLETLVPFMTGMCVVMADMKDQADPAALGRLMQRHGVNMLQSTPSRLRLLLEAEAASSGLEKLTDIMIGGEAFGMDLVHRLRVKSRARIYNMYGPTETTVWSMVSDLTETEEVTLGKPIANTEILLLDRNGQLQPFGTVGELCIAGSGLSRGYHNRADLTRERFVAHPLDPDRRIYKTGDFAQWQADGKLVYLGRRDHQLKIRGYRVELGEIEQALARFPGLASPLVAARKRNDEEAYLVCYYLADEEMPVASLREYLAERLPNYMIPGAFVRLDRYPLLPNGKINRSALPDPVVTRRGLAEEYREASNDRERRLAELWLEVVELEKIGMDDNLFEVGGSSISLVQFHGKLNKIYPNRIGVAELFAYPTIGKLAARLDQSSLKQPVSIPTLRLPHHFLKPSGSAAEGNTLRFRLKPREAEEVSGLARRYDVGVDDILLAAGLYLFTEITERPAVTALAMAGKENELVLLSADMREIADFPQLFQNVCKMRTQAADAYDLKDIRVHSVRRTVGEITPLFYRSAMDTSYARMSDLFGFTLGYSVEADTIVFTCDYDSGEIGQKSIEEWISGYGRLLRVLVNHFLKEASQH